MRFNNVIDALRYGCRELSREYAREYEKQYRASMCFYRYLVINEIEAQLCTLVDTEFSDFAEFSELVRGVCADHTDMSLRNPGEEALEYMREAEKAFLSLLEAVEPDCAAPEIPYFRYLTGEERETVISRFREQWGYVPEKYWYPMNGQEIREDRLFLHTDYVEDYWPRLEKLLGLPEKRIYCYGETNRPGLDCTEMGEVVGCGGLEEAYCDKDFNWIIYFSHEETVTFAGTILPEVQKLLEPEGEHWNCWE